MKKQIAIIVISLMFPLMGISQTRDLIVNDPALTTAVAGGIGSEVAIQDQIHNSQDKIVELQTTIASFQGVIKTIEEKTYKYLSTASDLLIAANYIHDMGIDIDKSRQNLADCLEIVADEPYLALITIRVDEVIVSRMADLLSYVTNVSFVYDEDSGSGSGNRPKNLLNNAERMEFVFHVSNELKVIKGYTAHLKSNLQTAKKQSVFQNLCPKTYQVVRNCEYTYNNILRNFHL